MKPKEERRELEKLYAQIPKFKCISGCTDCCGPVPASREEIRRSPQLGGYIDQLEQLVSDDVRSWCATCPYARENHGCAIYNERPLLCRLFGATVDPRLQCVHGCGPERPLSQAVTNQLMLRYLKIMGGFSTEERLREHAAWKAKAQKEGFSWPEVMGQ